MGDEPQHMPHAVLAAAIPVLIYSFFCLSLGVLLVTVLHRTRAGLIVSRSLPVNLPLLIFWKMLRYLLSRQPAPL
jgi:hypothetical protein